MILIFQYLSKLGVTSHFRNQLTIVFNCQGFDDFVFGAFEQHKHAYLFLELADAECMKQIDD